MTCKHLQTGVAAGRRRLDPDTRPGEAIPAAVLL